MRRHRRRQLLFVTGGRGFIGHHLLNGPASERWEVIAPGSSSLDVRNRDTTLEAIVGWKPDAIIHLAYDKQDARTIIDGTHHVAEAAAFSGARLVHMSTDMVFPGQVSAYTELETPKPNTDYGRQKLAAEQYVTDIVPSAVIVRTSIVIGTDRFSPVQKDIEMSLRGGPGATAYFTDEFRCPVHADDLAIALTTLARTHDISGPLHVAGPEAVSRFEFAELMAHYLRQDPSVLRSTTHAEQGVTRPGRLVLDSSRAARLGIRCRGVYAVLHRPV